MLGLELGVHAQESVFLQQYREKVKAYFLPSLSGNANASYTGNPLELYRELPSIETPLYFQGRDTKYGASVTLLQPVYSGGALKAGEIPKGKGECLVRRKAGDERRAVSGRPVLLE